jgi:threonine dehydrogenase-like Zn-dependent dehydrogenase
MDLSQSRVELAQQFSAKTINGRTMNLNVDGSLKAAVKALTGEVGSDDAIDTPSHARGSDN